MNYETEFLRWYRSELLSEREKTALQEIESNEEIKELHFGSAMSFGTAGLRSVMDFGPACMNVYTFSQATQGIANLIISENGADRGVVIAYDSRNNSELFAKTAASVLAANRISVYLFDGIRPTPELSFAVRELGCIAGINITASHNSKEYNGYKAYWDDGAQVLAPHDKGIIDEVNKVSVADIKFEGNPDLIQVIGKEIK